MWKTFFCAILNNITKTVASIGMILGKIQIVFFFFFKKTGWESVTKYRLPGIDFKKFLKKPHLQSDNCNFPVGSHVAGASEASERAGRGRAGAQRGLHEDPGLYRQVREVPEVCSTGKRRKRSCGAGPFLVGSRLQVQKWHLHYVL